MTLDEAIDHEKALSELNVDGNGPCQKWCDYHAKILEWLLELKERRESDLRPAMKFLTNTPSQQFQHVLSEVQEATAEVEMLLRDYKERFVEELIDTQMSIETELYILGLNTQQIREARRKVIAKNEVRGYYDKA